MARLDQQGTEIEENAVVENWQGRRAIAHYAGVECSMQDDYGELKTPVRIVGKVGEAPFETPESVPVNKPWRKPAWYKK